MIVHIFGLVMPAIFVGLFVGAPPSVHADEPQTLAKVTRQFPCVQDMEHHEDAMTSDGQTTVTEPCSDNAKSIPVVRTPPVLVAPNLEPVTRPQPIVRKGIAPEMLEFLRQIHGRILEVREYPPNAIKLGLQGTATVKLNLMPDGQAHALRIRKSSGHEMLDEAALEAVQKVLPLKPPPQAGNRPLELDIPIGFALR